MYFSISDYSLQDLPCPFKKDYKDRFGTICALFSYDFVLFMLTLNPFQIFSETSIAVRIFLERTCLLTFLSDFYKMCQSQEISMKNNY